MCECVCACECDIRCIVHVHAYNFPLNQLLSTTREAYFTVVHISMTEGGGYAHSSLVPRGVWHGDEANATSSSPHS